jgi:hypothetical protein
MGMENSIIVLEASLSFNEKYSETSAMGTTYSSMFTTTGSRISSIKAGYVTLR